MPRRKEKMAERLKEARREKYFAVLRNNPTSTRKMRLVADLIRGKGVYEAMNILKYSKQEAARKLEKLLKSAINNYEQKSGLTADENLFVSEIQVNQSVTLKRFLPAPQGRAYRIRKRSNHVTLCVKSKTQQPEPEPVAEATENEAQAGET
ncbi:MAG: 50S ribosomal protein L22 [Chitinophagales bacterium]|nr:50S ribosomal protein L22 [Chitinophagales bacterium]MDW8420072.1 50S ribosomal protein L22 [Chitinophagales bacterium]